MALDWWPPWETREFMGGVGVVSGEEELELGLELDWRELVIRESILRALLPLWGRVGWLEIIVTEGY